MTAAAILAAATRPAPTTARGVIEARLGRPLGPIADMPRDWLAEKMFTFGEGQR